MTATYNALWAELLVTEWVRHGVTTFVVSPGSRSTCLTVAAARCPAVRVLRAVDERAAAFLALGHARATGRPAPVITTSGSAVANLYPAVVEAARDHVPLVLLTADRPPELLDCGANQAVDQTRCFGSYLRWEAQLPCPTGAIDPAFVLTTVDQAWARCADGPVHLNSRFREPFYGPEDVTVADCPSLAAWGAADTPWTTPTQPVCGAEAVAPLVPLVQGAERGLLLIGRLRDEAERTAVRSLALKLDWPVYADIRSGLRLEFGTHLLRYCDQERLDAAFKDAVAPDVVLHLGSRVVSKRVPLFLLDRPPRHILHVDPAPERQDPIHRVTRRVTGDIAAVATALTEAVTSRGPSPYAERVAELANRIHDRIGAALDAEASLTEAHVAAHLTELLPAGHGLVLGNSMPVRDVDLYGSFDRLADTPVAVNRGASGIDGTLATAAGFAQGQGVPVTVLLGDQACLHDLNSLFLLREIEPPVVIVVINNGGGGIFHFLPIAAQTDVFDRYFRMPHDLRLDGICRSFGLDYAQPEDAVAFEAAYRAALRADRHTLIEVVTDSAASAAFRRRLKEDLLTLFTV